MVPETIWQSRLAAGCRDRAFGGARSRSGVHASGELVSATGAAAARRRRTHRRLFLDELLARRLHLRDELLVASGVEIRVLLRIRLQLLVLARQVEEPAVRAEENV